ncbi:MAG TPA: OmpW family outer membrane protein [Thermoanaerobaculia bacterium]|nr:OmpW family outer membrane protein [Thermoanaerobaculia bacterium]
MRLLVPAVLALSLVLPASAQSRFFDLTGSVVWVDPSNSGSFEDLADPATIDFDGDTGYGAAANIFFSDRFSLEVAIARVSTGTTVRRRAVANPGGDLEMMPVTGVVQWHLLPHAMIDPYIGAGAAYVLFDDVSDNGVSGLQRIDFEDDAGLAVNAGVGIRLGNRFGIVLDGKYVPLESNARATVLGTGQTSESKVDISPIILSAGVSLRF